MILASQHGVFWSRIPTMPGGSYSWQRASGIPVRDYYNVAIGNDKSTSTVVVSQYDSGNPGLYVGRFVGNDLLFEAARVPPVDVVIRPGAPILYDPAWMGTISVAACASARNIMYAGVSYANGVTIAGRPDVGGWLMAVLRSTDGGQTWSRTPSDVTNTNPPAVLGLFSNAGNNGNTNPPNNCVTVASNNPNVVALGWRRGPFISEDGAFTWRENGDDGSQSGAWTPHLHSDLRAVYFRPGSNPERLFVASDEGVAATDTLGKVGDWDSSYSQRLLNLEIYEMSASARVPGAVAIATQDNGALVSNVSQGTSARWEEIEGGDAFHIAVLDNAYALSATYDTGGGSTKFAEFGPSPVALAPPVLTRDVVLGPLNGSINYQFANAEVVAVNYPSWHDTIGARLIGVAIGNIITTDIVIIGTTHPGQNLAAAVFGLFDPTPGRRSDLVLRVIGYASLQTGEALKAVASFNGQHIFVGTSTGRIQAFFPDDSRPPTEYDVGPRPSGGEPGAGITRFAMTGLDNGFAIYNSDNQARVLRNDDSLSFLALAGLPSLQGFTGLAVDYWTPWTRGRPNVFVCTDTDVFGSNDNGDTWGVQSLGLPTTPHCSGLQVAPGRQGVQLYLATYGRSVWVADIPR